MNDYKKTKYFDISQIDYIRISLKERQTIDSISKSLGVSSTTFRKYLKNSNISIKELKTRVGTYTTITEGSTSLALELRRLMKKYPNLTKSELAKRVNITEERLDIMIDYYNLPYNLGRK